MTILSTSFHCTGGDVCDFSSDADVPAVEHAESTAREPTAMSLEAGVMSGASYRNRPSRGAAIKA
ncbi:MAG TPA: hypothetical protein VKT00_05420 [Casimicrobiaceae bacterium]|nr:hypothetical protein [Casimicrobiaceae bacterium]